MVVVKSSISYASRTWEKMTVHKLFSYIFVFWSVLNKTGMTYLYNKDGITFIPKKSKSINFQEFFAFFIRLSYKMKLYQKSLI